MELRMLSGLHRGAVLELGGEAVALGASHEADIILADPGIATIHLTIVKSGDRYQLYPSEGAVFAENGAMLQGPVDIVRGARYRIGEIWIGFFDAGDSWDEILPAIVAPPLPMPEPEVEVAPPRKSLRDRLLNKWIDLRQSRSKMIGAIALALATVLGIVWIGSVLYLKSSGDKELYEKANQAKKKAETPVFGIGPLGEDKPGSREKLISELRRMLSERDLLDRIDIVFGDDVWDIRGALDGEEQGRLERTLANFNKTYHPPFGLRASVVPVKDLLPFKIVEVTVGRYSNVVTDSGKRLFVGDVLDGYKLVAVDKNKLVFVGKLRIEFAW